MLYLSWNHLIQCICYHVSITQLVVFLRITDFGRNIPSIQNYVWCLFVCSGNWCLPTHCGNTIYDWQAGYLLRQNLSDGDRELWMNTAFVWMFHFLNEFKWGNVFYQTISVRFGIVELALLFQAIFNLLRILEVES